MARKRSFTQMSCDYGSITLLKNDLNSTSPTPVLIPSKLKRKQRKNSQKNGKKLCLNNNEEKSNNNEIKHNYFAYIDNPKPSKRQKISHNYKTNKLNKTKLILNEQKKSNQKPSKSVKNNKHKILHQCILRDRWNMLTSPRKSKKSSNLPILSILNDFSTKQESKQEIIDEFESLHYENINNRTYKKIQKNNEYNNYISSDTDSVNSYDTAYPYWFHDNMPTMSITDSDDTQNSENIFIQNMDMIQKNKQNTIKTMENVQYQSTNQPSTIYQYQQHQQQPVQQQNINNYVTNNLQRQQSPNRVINDDIKCNDVNNDNKYESKWNINYRLQEQYRMNYDQRVQPQPSSQPLNDDNNSNESDININRNSETLDLWSKDYLLKLPFFGLIALVMLKYYTGYEVNFVSICDLSGFMCEDGAGFVSNYLGWIVLTIIVSIIFGYGLINYNNYQRVRHQSPFRFNFRDNENGENIQYFNSQNVTINNYRCNQNFVFNR